MPGKNEKYKTLMTKLLGLVKQVSEIHNLPVFLYTPKHDNQNGSIFGTRLLKEWFQKKIEDEKKQFEELIKEEIKELTSTRNPLPSGEKEKPKRATRADLNEARAAKLPAKLPLPLEFMRLNELVPWLREEYLRVYQAAGGLKDQINWGKTEF